MGKATRWFRSLLGYKKSQTGSSSAPEPLVKEKKKKSVWGLAKLADTSAERRVSGVQFKNVEDPLASPYVEAVDANRHAIAVAAATAAVAEAAVAAAQAAAEVVRLTSGGMSGRSATEYLSVDRRRVVAAVKIQSAFRAYLARRAFRALKGLVKLQALVRGRIVRKRSTDMLHRMQAMARIQARASAHRTCMSDSSNYCHPGIMNLRNNEPRSSISKQGGSQQCNSRLRSGNTVYKEGSNVAANRLDRWMEQSTWNNHKNASNDVGCNDDEISDKILEIDTWKPRQNTRLNELNERTSPISQYFSAWTDKGREHSRNDSASRLSSKLQKPNPSSKLQKPNPSISSEEVLSVLSPMFPSPMFPREGDRVAAWTAQNSPIVHYASSRPTTSNRRGSFTPTRSECSRSSVGDYYGHPNYMANTESSLAKVRSQSLPKQRTQLEEVGAGGKFGHVLWESDIRSEKGSILSVNGASNAYLYSGHLKRQGTPTRGAAVSFSTEYGHML